MTTPNNGPTAVEVGAVTRSLATRTATALHEAGHAVAALMAGVRIEYVTTPASEASSRWLARLPSAPSIRAVCVPTTGPATVIMSLTTR